MEGEKDKAEEERITQQKDMFQKGALDRWTRGSKEKKGVEGMA